MEFPARRGLLCWVRVALGRCGREVTMKHHKYIIVGGGMAADSAVHGILEVDGSGTIAVIAEEKHPPYDRPPLTKALWKGSPLESIWRKTGGERVALHLGRKVVAIDPVAKSVTDHGGIVYTYDKLLLATGGRPRRLPSGDDTVVYFRTVDDYRSVRSRAATGSHCVVIGGGFIGSELAAALAMNGVQVTMVFPERAIGARPYPSELADFLNTYYRDKGVRVLAGETVAAIEKQDSKSIVTTSGAREIDAAVVVAGIGIQPNTELATAAGLAVEHGIVVDELLRTSHPDIYAAGDVANFHNPALQQRMRVEHEDNANTMGRIAGRNMAGQSDPYHHLPFFYSDLFELGYEAVGELDSHLDLIEDWKEPFRKGVVYYLKEGKVRGVLLWNTWGQVPAARELISSHAQQSKESLLGRITD
jgi:3-phenylpropionate/trans-cinnamate dioxygenase ferredoxin reductase component